ncbi:CPXCG motif-containing cysteine-rich protein [Paraglaciecola arctica]|uniref:Zn-ribbon protein n=1 Tax=Paraglaciecola arctica BSs20135 TaxID=493475 RepID=K6YVK8_9ALTE|nr:CPXCG motif-containing cysteine-rich protein [Paraglaciecola arctica]GAC20748.1 zn-ribbon protein [Paraglaciecola arctica BSs20135]
MSLTEIAEFSCPYCMVTNDLEIDEDNDLNQQQIVDCRICCSPIEVVVTNGIHDRFNIIATTDSE